MTSYPLALWHVQAEFGDGEIDNTYLWAVSEKQAEAIALDNDPTYDFATVTYTRLPALPPMFQGRPTGGVVR